MKEHAADAVQTPELLASLPQYDAIIADAKKRAQEHGLSLDVPPGKDTGREPIFDWFLAYWVPRGESFEEFKRQYLPYLDEKEASRRWDKYRDTYGIPTLTELKRLKKKL
jgi:hypothetical protein